MCVCVVTACFGYMYIHFLNMFIEWCFFVRLFVPLTKYSMKANQVSKLIRVQKKHSQCCSCLAEKKRRGEFNGTETRGKYRDCNLFCFFFGFFFVASFDIQMLGSVSKASQLFHVNVVKQKARKRNHFVTYLIQSKSN